MLDRCDNVVGTGSELITAGRYTVGEGDDKQTRYKFGIKFDYPEFTPEQDAISLDVGRRRQVSVEAAGTFNAANDYGTVEDAEAFQKMISSQDGWTELQTVKKREGGGAKVDTKDSLIRRNLIFNVKEAKTAEQIAAAGLPAVPKTVKGSPNWAAWAKTVMTEHRDHKWVQAVEKSLAKGPKLED